MKKVVYLFLFLAITFVTNACRENETMLSNEDVTNFKIIENNRTNRSSDKITSKKDSTLVGLIRTSEQVPPPRQ